MGYAESLGVAISWTCIYPSGDVVDGSLTHRQR